MEKFFKPARLAIVVVMLTFMHPPTASATECQVDIDTSHFIHRSREDFLSIALDCSLIGNHWETFDPTNAGIVAMAKGLSPAILRLGGTSCDYVIFNDTRLSELPTDPMWRKLGSILHAHDWDRLVQLSHIANFTMLYDANVMLRDANDNWDPTNFETFLKYNQNKNTSNLIFELGNEPNNYPAHFNKTISGPQLAADFGTLKKTIGKYSLFEDHLIVGADVGNPYIRGLQLDPATYIHDFFKAGHSFIDALTWHQYYMKGSTAHVEDFINPHIMDSFQLQVDIVSSIVKNVLGPNATFPLWMGETSSAYNSGAPNISNRYAAGFLWMDKLGVSAQNRYDVVIRQTFYGGWYSLVDSKLQPRPDYWLSLLYKRLVGTRALSVKSAVVQQSVRIYASCTNAKSRLQAGAITLYAMNLNKTSSVTITTSLNTTVVLAYNLEPTDGTLTSPYVNVNGKMMQLVNNSLPAILPRITNAIVLKPLTFGFFVLNDANAKACI